MVRRNTLTECTPLPWSTYDLRALASIRFFRACIKSNNHFLHRHLMKHHLLAPMIEMLDPECPRDNMLSSSCLEVFEMIRKVRIASQLDDML